MTMSGRRILELYREGNLTEEEQKCAYDVTFKEFMMYFSSHTDRLLEDPHWRQFNDKCHPCVIKYDKVIKLETGFSDEIDFISENLKPLHNNDDNIPYNNSTSVNEDIIRQNTRAGYTQNGVYLRNSRGNFSEDILAKDNYRQIYEEFADIRRIDYDVIKELYEQDLDLFGFGSELKRDGMHATCETRTESGDICC